MNTDTDIKVGVPVPRQFKQWLMNDRDHSEKWREEAKRCWDFVAGRQWTDEQIAELQEKTRPVVVFNRIGTVIDSIHGHEIGNRREVRYIPREVGDIKANELLTGAADWFRDQSHADNEESDAFLDTVIAGMGWTETRIDFEDTPEGTPVIERVDPMEMFWDFDAKRRNISDARRVWQVRRVPYSEAKVMFPGHSVSDLDATWVIARSSEDFDLTMDAADEDGSEDKMVTLVQCQWVEREAYYKAYDPMSGQEAEFTEAEFKTANSRMKKLIGVEMQAVRLRRKVRKQAFFGKVVLAVGNAPCPKKFSLQCITGKRDRNKKIFYGIVRAMIDPQLWANKWLSQMMHIMNSNAKGGLMAEKGAFDNQLQAEESWADPEAITWMEDGALASGKVKEKSQTQFPVGFQQLTEFAISSIRDVSGVSVEMLGMREANQAASLEAQRRQAGMTILLPFFDGLKHYREMQGSVMLHYIQNDLSDGRLIRITGEQGQQYVPLIREATEEFDIIVDDAPNSPNQKEEVWALMTQLLPMLGAQLPPPFLMKAMEYSPLPTNVVEDLQKMAEGMQQAEAPKHKMAAERAAAEIDKIKSETMENQVDARSKMVRSDLDKREFAKGVLEAMPHQPGLT